MKRLLTLLAIPTFIAQMLLPIYAASATVNINALSTTGLNLPGVEVTCKLTPPNTGGLPPAPQFTYLTTNGSGIATWNVDLQTGATYGCTSRTGVVYVSNVCYSMSGGGTFTLAEGEVKAVTLTATPAPGYCTSYGEGSTGNSGTTTNNNSGGGEASTPEKAAVASSTLPEKFRKEGSETSDLSELTTESAKSVENLTIDDTEQAKIKFTEAVDLSGEDVAELFNNLDSYILMNRGSVEVKSDTLPFLNKKATVTLYSINLSSEKVSVYRDGVLDAFATETAKYSLEERTLTFDVEGFSRYEIGSDLVLNAPPAKTSESEITITGSVIDKGSKLELIINNGKPLIVEFDIRGEFTELVQLSEGKNNLILTATSTSGLQTIEQFEVERITNKIAAEKELTGVYIAVGATSAILATVGAFIGVKVYKKRKVSNTGK